MQCSPYLTRGARSPADVRARMAQRDREYAAFVAARTTGRRELNASDREYLRRLRAMGAKPPVERLTKVRLS